MDLTYGVQLVASSIVFVLPAYIANMTPLIVARLISKRRPMDLGRYWIDGRRILGDSKSIEGFISGVLSGFLVGLFLNDVLRGFLMGLGAMTGDALGSFIKRRLGMAQGESALLLDQYLFVLVALLFCYSSGYMLTLDQLVVILVATPILHISSNYVAYLLGIKQKPL
ncbi:MAG: CDP-2,3-bis-(O-geranylgeranyl)-sn-glycerol synthase [Candidatus Nezhaarchaeales archaeon]